MQTTVDQSLRYQAVPVHGSVYTTTCPLHMSYFLGANPEHYYPTVTWRSNQNTQQQKHTWSRINRDKPDKLSSTTNELTRTMKY